MSIDICLVHGVKTPFTKTFLPGVSKQMYQAVWQNTVRLWRNFAIDIWQRSTIAYGVLPYVYGKNLPLAYGKNVP